MRRTLSAADAKKHLADALRRAEAGDLVLITRYRKPVAALVGVERLARLEDAPALPGAAEATVAGPIPPEVPPETPAKAAPTLRELRDSAAAGSLRRIEADLARVPEGLRPALRLIRANLFRPRLTVERLKAALQVGANDFTTDFRDATGVTIHRYLTDRRLEVAARLLLDTELEAGAIRPSGGLRPPGGPFPGLRETLWAAAVDLPRVRRRAVPGSGARRRGRPAAAPAAAARRHRGGAGGDGLRAVRR